ncbi:MAG: putative ABC transporter-binding protein [Saprospiraceae bacterium]|nr:MAG: putative ABC transporter-binding protein [Saprospiraceae bacterium]
MMLLLLILSCQRNEPVEITFAFGPDDTGAVQQLVDNFNQGHEGDIHVNWKETSRLSNEFYREIEKDFTSETPVMDVIGADVVWTSAFAQKEWVEDLSEKFYETHKTGDFLEASLNSVIHQFRIWGVPWYTDAGILYYRKDLLTANGYNKPPVTWNELKMMSKAIMQKDQAKYGFVFQGANYEGGVANACEYIWNAGGEILIGDLSANVTTDPEAEEAIIITVNSPEVVNGLREAYAIVQSGISPADVYDYKELEAVQTFEKGDAVFMRGWPGVYGRLLKDGSKVKPEQIGLAALPVSTEGNKSFSCLGGWNLMINAKSAADKKAAAWTFIEYMTAPKQQKYLSGQAGIMPSLVSLYDDEELIKKVPVISLAKGIIDNTRVRPVTAHYMEISPDIAWNFNAVLKGQLTPAEAVETIQAQMEVAMAPPL